MKKCPECGNEMTEYIGDKGKFVCRFCLYAEHQKGVKVYFNGELVTEEPDPIKIISFDPGSTVKSAMFVAINTPITVLQEKLKELEIKEEYESCAILRDYISLVNKGITALKAHSHPHRP